MSDHLHLVLERAKAEGLLPQDAPHPVPSERPWPVVLLTALGAWLAAIPLLAVVGMLLGDLISRSVGPYLVGALVLGGAVVVLRARDVPLFVEQLAVPALLVGGGSLGFGLFRDLPDQGAALVLALVAIGLAFTLVHPWLRVLLGAAASSLALFALTPARFFDTGASDTVWLAAHAVLGLWLSALWAQRHYLNTGARAKQAAALESISGGWILLLLAALAALSGTTFLVGASLGGGFIGDIARHTGERNASALLPWLLRGVSLALALVAVAVAQRAWPSLRQPLYLGAAVILAALAWFLPALGAGLLVLALTASTQRFLLAGAAALSCAWIVGSFYYQLQWELATKALILVAAGVLLGALAWLVHVRSTRTGTPATDIAPGGRPAIAMILLAAVATLAVANTAIWQKETLIAEGRPVFIPLAPVDPRSLMQGDFMRLNFNVPVDVNRTDGPNLLGGRAEVVARLDTRGVATDMRFYQSGMPLAEDEFRIELTPKDGRWVVVTDAWFFREGDGARWEAARFGEFRIDSSGKALLVGMADAELKPIAP